MAMSVIKALKNIHQCLEYWRMRASVVGTHRCVDTLVIRNRGEIGQNVTMVDNGSVNMLSNSMQYKKQTSSWLR